MGTVQELRAGISISDTMKFVPGKRGKKTHLYLGPADSYHSSIAAGMHEAGATQLQGGGRLSGGCELYDLLDRLPEGHPDKLTYDPGQDIMAVFTLFGDCETPRKISPILSLAQERGVDDAYVRLRAHGWSGDFGAFDPRQARDALEDVGCSYAIDCVTARDKAAAGKPADYVLDETIGLYVRLRSPDVTLARPEVMRLFK